MPLYLEMTIRRSAESSSEVVSVSPPLNYPDGGAELAVWLRTRDEGQVRTLVARLSQVDSNRRPKEFRHKEAPLEVGDVVEIRLRRCDIPQALWAEETATRTEGSFNRDPDRG